MSTFVYNQSFVGAYLFTTLNKNYLLGTRTGIHQDLLASAANSDFNARIPDTVFLSDLTVKDRVSCLDLEFVFLASLFYGMDFTKGQTCSRLYDFKEKKIIRKFRVVVEEGEDHLVVNQLEPSLLGASRGFLKNHCRLNKELWQMLANEALFFNLKDKDGNIFQLSDFLEIHHWDENGQIEIDGFTVKKTSRLGDFEVLSSDGAKLVETSVDFDVKKVQPVWDIPQSQEPFSFSDISVVPLGTASPFSTDEPPTCYWLKLGARENYLIDCGFFSDLTFERNGGSLDSIKGLIITHCHGDHFNPIPFLYRQSPIELWTTLENYKLAQKITCAKAKIEPEEFQRRFIFKQVEAMYPGFTPPRYRFGLLDFEFHYSVHPIPTIGLTIYRGTEKIAVFSSDMVDLKFVKESMEVKGILSKERVDMIFERFRQEGNPNTLFFLDCGGDGFIHGRANGYSSFFSDPTKVVECHRQSRKSSDDLSMRLAEPLALIEFLSFDQEARTTSLICQMLSDLGVKYFAEWAVRMKAGAKSVKLSPQQPVLLSGRKVAPKFYLVDFGNCRSASGLTFGPGEWFGEEALLGEGEYFTSIYSNSPVMLLELDANLMLQILNENSVAGRALTEVIRKKSRLRNALTLTKLFADLQVSASLVDGIALDISLERFPAGETVFRKGQVDEGHMFIIDSGVLRIDLGRNRQFEKGKNEMVGDIVASGAQSTRSADIQAVTPATLIKLPRLTFQKLLEDVRIYRRFQEIVSQYERAA